jgi:hypothetical protein
MVQNAKTLIRKTLVPVALFAGLTQALATPVTDDCTAGSGCIQTSGGKGVFDYYGKFHVDSGGSEGQVAYSDENFTVSSDKLIDYADPDGMGGYRILTFELNDSNLPQFNQIRIVVNDLGDVSTDDTFEVQLVGGSYYAVSGHLLADCNGGIAISQDCSVTENPPPPTPTPTPNPPPAEDCDDFLTGGGWIIGPGGKKANFGVRGGMRPNPWGGLNYLDHATGMHVKSKQVTSYTHISETGREIHYNVLIDGAPGTAIVQVVDNGEPGRNDTFAIWLSNGYHASGDLGGPRPGGGNIQLHKPHCDKGNNGGKDHGKCDNDKDHDKADCKNNNGHDNDKGDCKKDDRDNGRDDHKGDCKTNDRDNGRDDHKGDCKTNDRDNDHNDKGGGKNQGGDKDKNCKR